MSSNGFSHLTLKQVALYIIASNPCTS